MSAKWIGALIGFFVFRGMGALIGFLIGSAIDAARSINPSQSEKKRIYFIDNLLVLFAFVMKADGRVTKTEVYYVREFLQKNFGTDQANIKMLELRDLLKDDTLELNQTCNNINRQLNYSQKLELLHFLFGISSADAEISKQELNLIHTIASYLRISAWDFGTIQAMYFNSNSSGYNYGNSYGNAQQNSQAQIDNAYTILQVNKDSTNDEIKKSYRKLVVKYHPDKVASLGEDIQKQANEKFQQINAAYELIKKERNFS
ncbi:MAG: TerB family tellurite resistance protein [Bacteroidales bacterium]|nr:TerB family tellurite resistance protein [Bacteroidales bacterium]